MLLFEDANRRLRRSCARSCRSRFRAARVPLTARSASVPGHRMAAFCLRHPWSPHRARLAKRCPRGSWGWLGDGAPAPAVWNLVCSRVRALQRVA